MIVFLAAGSAQPAAKPPLNRLWDREAGRSEWVEVADDEQSNAAGAGGAVSCVKCFSALVIPPLPCYLSLVLVGILSDTHDRIENATAGMELLRAGAAEFYIHCGDVGTEPIIDLLAGLRSALVWGNNDWDRRHLSQYAQRLGVMVLPPMGEIGLDGKRFAVMHGDDARLVKRVVDLQQHDYLLLGHSHVRTDQQIGKIRMINPGALHRAAEKSVALLDTASNTLKFLLL